MGKPEGSTCALCEDTTPMTGCMKGERRDHRHLAVQGPSLVKVMSYSLMLLVIIATLHPLSSSHELKGRDLQWGKCDEHSNRVQEKSCAGKDSFTGFSVTGTLRLLRNSV